MDPIKILAPISLTLVGLSTALFLNIFVLESPTLREDRLSIFRLQGIRLPDLLSLLPATNRNPKSNFGSLISELSEATTPIPLPVGSPPLRTKIIVSPAPASSATDVPPDAPEITDVQINALVSGLIPPNTPVRDVQIKFEIGKILISGELLLPVTGKFNAEAEVNLENGLPVVRITRASLGSFPIPTFFLGSLETAANTAIRSSLASQNIVKIKKLEITEGKISFSVSLN